MLLVVLVVVSMSAYLRPWPEAFARARQVFSAFQALLRMVWTCVGSSPHIDSS